MVPLVLLAFLASAVAVKFDCNTLLPTDTNYVLDTSDSPYQLIVDACKPDVSCYYKLNNLLSVIIVGSAPFQALALQAHIPEGSASTSPLGKWLPSANDFDAISCDGKTESTLVTTVSKARRNVRLTWKSPVDDTGTIEFVASIIDGTGRLWKLKSVLVDQEGMQPRQPTTRPPLIRPPPQSPDARKIEELHDSEKEEELYVIWKEKQEEIKKLEDQQSETFVSIQEKDKEQREEEKQWETVDLEKVKEKEETDREKLIRQEIVNKESNAAQVAEMERQAEELKRRMEEDMRKKLEERARQREMVTDQPEGLDD